MNINNAKLYWPSQTRTENERLYLNMLQEVLHSQHNSTFRRDRTGTGTISQFPKHLVMNLRDGSLPVTTTKKLFFKGVVVENLWYLKGTGNIKFLQDNGVKIWNQWADDNGDLGPVYGAMWRHWPGPLVEKTWEELTDRDREVGYYAVGANKVLVKTEVDQIAEAVRLLKEDPTSRRILVTSLNPAYAPDTKLAPRDNVQFGKQALPPCHYTFQLYAQELSTQERMDRYQLLSSNGTWPKMQLRPKHMPDMSFDDRLRDLESHLAARKECLTMEDLLAQSLDTGGVPRYELSLKLEQRSCDLFLGGAFNMTSYSLLLRKFCEVANMFPGEFAWDIGDAHIYSNHVDQVKEQLARAPFDAPLFAFNRRVTDIDDFKIEDFNLIGYKHHEPIIASVAV